MPDLRIHLFGQLQVLIAGQTIPNEAWRGQMPRTLLQFLAARPDGQATSEELMEALWSHLPSDRARPNLQETVRRLRAILAAHAGGAAGATLLPYTGAGYRLPDHTWTDLGALHQRLHEVRRLQEQDPEAALRLLAQTELPAPETLLPEHPYADWAISARDSARHDTIALRLLHGDLLWRSGAAREALDRLRTVLALDPVRESTAQLAMQIAAQLGDRVAALDIFDRCRRALAEELGVDPMPETLEIYTMVLRTDTAAAGLMAHAAQTGSVQAPSNLPAQPTSFIGRQAEMAAVRGRFPGTRLLTITGAGGAGKTRLALQAAADLLPARPDGVWFVELSALSDPELVPAVVASTLGLVESPGRSPQAVLVEHLRSKQMLLVLDNCEHLVEASAVLADTLLRSSPGLWILATSREALGIPGEALWPLPPLREFDGVALFLERAAALVPGFAATAATAPTIASICRRLDGMPLAIELAAAMVKILSVAEIDTRLDERFRLLMAGSRTAPPRQKTLRGAVDWSYEHLSVPERLLWRRLSVFAGGFTLAAAEAVCAGADLPLEQVLTVLHRLVDKSLVIADEQNDERRFRMLETIREYGLERLREAGEERAVRARHYDWCLALAEAVSQEQWGPRWVDGYDRLEREHDNLRAALDGCRGVADGPGRAVQLAWKLVHFWDTWGHVQEGRQRVAELLASPEAPLDPRTHALLLTLAAYLAGCQGDYQGGVSSAKAGLAIWHELGDRLGQAHCLFVLGICTLHDGDVGSAVASFEESLALFQALEAEPYIRLAMFYLAEALLAQGDYWRARAMHQECLALRRATQDRVISFSLLALARLAIMADEPARAMAFVRESLPLWEPRFKRGLTISLDMMATVAITAGQAERAVCLIGAADRIRRAIGLGARGETHEESSRALAKAATRLGEAAFAAAWAQGQSMSPEQATAYALSDPAADQ